MKFLIFLEKKKDIGDNNNNNKYILIWRIYKAQSSRKTVEIIVYFSP